MTRMEAERMAMELSDKAAKGISYFADPPSIYDLPTDWRVSRKPGNIPAINTRGERAAWL